MNPRTIRPAATVTTAEPGEPWRWITYAAEQGHQGSSRLLHVGPVQAPPDVAKAFDLPDGGEALLRSQVLLLDGEPAELADCYYPLDLAEGTPMMERRKIRGGTAGLLAEMGYPPRKTIDLVSARVPTQREYKALELPSDLPVLRTFRVVLSDDDRPIEATVMANAGHLYQLQYEIP
ncbi:GntR family transcriptional regulator [Actinomadura rayongensis]|uniref:UTRA domain-containing protein n=1 Tax=Actinomadura rayongensis TaxID=1429076 RepID=A0A6I4W776_9ACTN|nr:UTRA domain-containing protein [Actinomadura rayongensis]MXQ62562.1 UTRA domain-containing protein [Actinomadura rayongensis]